MIQCVLPQWCLATLSSLSAVSGKSSTIGAADDDDNEVEASATENSVAGK